MTFSSTVYVAPSDVIFIKQAIGREYISETTDYLSSRTFANNHAKLFHTEPIVLSATYHYLGRLNRTL
jgi:hypothetical protein